MAQQRMNVQAPIERLLAERWSTRAFDPGRPVVAELLAGCLEAARWAPSCFGAEPWRYIVTDRYTDEAAWQLALSGLTAKNQRWAQHAPVLIIAAGDPVFSHNGSPNRWAEYDAGQATICLCLQAKALGLASHQMGGFDPEMLKAGLSIPAAMHVMSVVALGYAGDMDMLGEGFQPVETAARARKPLADIVHTGRWGAAYQAPASAGWEARYQETPTERLPWFHAELDADIGQALDTLALSGGAVLDLGCGPGTQALALAKRGFTVTASDVSHSAIDAAGKLTTSENVNIDFHADDVLNSRLKGPFDLVIDRGVFHCFPEASDQQAYMNTIRRILKAGGFLLLKCFHKDETCEAGPAGRYDEVDISRFFVDGFELVEAHATRFYSAAQDNAPKALFCILKRL